MNPYLLLGGAVALVLAIAAAIFGLNRWETRIDKAGYDRAMGLWAASTLKAQAEQRKIELERLEAQRKAQDEHKKQVDQANASADRAKSAVASLRLKLASLSSTGSNPPAAEGSKASPEVGTLLGNCAEEYQRMGVLAEQAYLAGQLCEQSYQALTR